MRIMNLTNLEYTYICNLPEVFLSYLVINLPILMYRPIEGNHIYNHEQQTIVVLKNLIVIIITMHEKSLKELGLLFV